MRIGTTYHKNNCEFTVWAPNVTNVKLTLEDNKQSIDMAKVGNGYWTTLLKQVEPELKYMFQLDAKSAKPDPASHFQPEGVFGPSLAINHEKYTWKDTSWHGLEFKELIFYEVHVGTFTPQGTLSAMQNRIAELADFGVNAIELMPVTQFSGSRGWGYDSVFPFALQNSYGVPDDLKGLVDECHDRGIAVFLDFVYNHIGPEGNILNDYAPYFVNNRMTTWGPNLNVDGPNSFGVRNYFLENTLHWFRDYHIDGIRLDAILWIADISPKHFLAELNQSVAKYAQEIGRRLYMIAETGYNEPAVLTSIDKDGYGFNAQWLDDYHHALFSQLTGENKSYYTGFIKLEDLVDALTDAYVYVKKPPEFRRRGSEEFFRQIPAYKFVVFSQNHDQIGNRLWGDRLVSISGYEAVKVAAGLILLSPYVPLLFMGEEYGDITPFLFFTDYQCKELAEKIREERRKEFTEFQWIGDLPDPQNPEWFTKSKIQWEKRRQGITGKITEYYKTLINLRKKVPSLQADEYRNIKTVNTQGKVLLIEKQKNTSKALIIANLGNETQSLQIPSGLNSQKVLDSTDLIFGGPGSGLPEKFLPSMNVPSLCFAVYLNQESFT